MINESIHAVSNTVITNPTNATSISQFGNGFYCFKNSKDTLEHASAKDKILNSYKTDYNSTELKILKFDSINTYWLDFILFARNYDINYYDIIEGPIIVEDIKPYIEQLFNGDISREFLLDKLKSLKSVPQVCYKTHKALQTIKYIKHKNINK